MSVKKIAQLGTMNGKVYITLIAAGYNPSTRTEVSFAAE